MDTEDKVRYRLFLRKVYVNYENIEYIAMPLSKKDDGMVLFYKTIDVSNVLAYYYRHSFLFYSKKDLGGTLIHTNTPVYELYYFN